MMLQSFVTAAKAGVHLAAARAGQWTSNTSRTFAEGSRVKGGSRLSPGRRLGSAALLVVVLGLPLAGCGKKNAPSPPPGVPNTYPRPYPSV